MNIIEKILFKFGYIKIEKKENTQSILDKCIDIKCESEISFHFNNSKNITSTNESIHLLQLNVSKLIYDEVLKNM